MCNYYIFSYLTSLPAMHKKNGFAEVSKNLTRYRSKNNFGDSK